jgi:hypothetical protein
MRNGKTVLAAVAAWILSCPCPAGDIWFVRGDANADGAVDISDPLNMLLELYAGVPVACLDAVDVNDDEVFDLADVNYSLEYLFIDANAIPAPYPLAGCDPSGDVLACASYRDDLPCNDTGAIIIDHAYAIRNPAEIPAETIAAAKARFKVFYGHTSHGLQILTGLNFVRVENPSLEFDRSYVNENKDTFFVEHNADLANPSWGAFDGITRAQLEKAGNDRNVVMWSWCTQLDWQRPTEEKVQTQYLDLMAALEMDYPDVIFVYFTSSTTSGPEGSGNQRNEQIRTYCRDNGKVLFDFADIERWDDDGTYFPWVDDACNYYGASGSRIGNWAQEWCARNPGVCPPYPKCDGINLGDLTCCAHSETINCVRKGRATWWLLAELAARS